MRLSKIVTKTGDRGTTGLGDGTRISKSSRRMDVIGDVDELNAYIGLVRTCLSDTQNGDVIGFFTLKTIQDRLFDLGGELSMPNLKIVDVKDVIELENIVNDLNDTLPPLKNFILPGGTSLVANIHVARTIARRAERSIVALNDKDDINPESIKFLNRLSDYLFVLARVHSNGQEVLWTPKEKSDV